MTINAKGRNALIQVAEWLESGAPHVVKETGEVIKGFDMGTAGDRKGCGTVCCIAGAVVAFNPEAFPDFIDPDNRMWRDWEDGNEAKDTVFARTKSFIGLDRHTAEQLFEPSNMRDRTAQEGAKVIRTFLKTGEVTWSELYND